jgi:hypothetical protein
MGTPFSRMVRPLTLHPDGGCRLRLTAAFLRDKLHLCKSRGAPAEVGCEVRRWSHEDIVEPFGRLAHKAAPLATPIATPTITCGRARTPAN